MIYQEINVVFSLTEIIYSPLRLPPRNVFNHISLTISKLVAQDVINGLYLEVFVMASAYLDILTQNGISSVIGAEFALYSSTHSLLVCC